MKNLEVFDTQTEYNNVEHAKPNVSYVKENGGSIL